MAIANDDPLMVKAAKLFPHRDYLEVSAVIRARVGYVQAVWQLRRIDRWAKIWGA